MTNPNSMSLSNWASALVIDLPNDNIPFFNKNDDWKKWGNLLIQENSFTRNGAPGTALYNSWEDWANAVYYTMSNL